MTKWTLALLATSLAVGTLLVRRHVALPAEPLLSAGPGHPVRDEPGPVLKERHLAASSAPPARPAGVTLSFRLQAAAPAQRAEVEDGLPPAPGRQDVAFLLDAIAHGADTRVRERAVFAYTEVMGPEAVPVLSDLALHDVDENVMAAARASLHRLKEEYPPPARARIEVVMPTGFTPGEPFDVRIRCVAGEDAPKARFELRVPVGVELVDGDPLQWRGPLAGDQAREHHYRFRATGPAAIRARFTADYADPLDAETVHLRLLVGDGTLTASTELTRT